MDINVLAKNISAALDNSARGSGRKPTNIVKLSTNLISNSKLEDIDAKVLTKLVDTCGFGNASFENAERVYIQEITKHMETRSAGKEVSLHSLQFARVSVVFHVSSHTRYRFAFCLFHTHP
jgi:hypothetical protein